MASRRKVTEERSERADLRTPEHVAEVENAIAEHRLSELLSDTPGIAEQFRQVRAAASQPD